MMPYYERRHGTHNDKIGRIQKQIGPAIESTAEQLVHRGYTKQMPPIIHQMSRCTELTGFEDFADGAEIPDFAECGSSNLRLRSQRNVNTSE